MYPDRTVTPSKGFWNGRLSNIPEPADHPRQVAGFSDALSDEADGSHGMFTGIFNALSALRMGGNDKGSATALQGHLHKGGIGGAVITAAHLMDPALFPQKPRRCLQCRRHAACEPVRRCLFL